jgi:ABC-type bacteriocin/lantibiotic exporter with double-glycine peptidase domain
MRFQSNSSSCGPAALRTALQCHGIRRSEEELEQLTGFTPAEGTPPKGLLKALAAISKDHPIVTPAILSESREQVAILRLVFALQNGSAAILVVDNDEHWVCAFGLMGAGTNCTIHVHDPADVEMVRHVKPGELAEWWRGTSKRAPFYAILV